MEGRRRRRYASAAGRRQHTRFVPETSLAVYGDQFACASLNVDLLMAMESRPGGVIAARAFFLPNGTFA